MPCAIQHLTISKTDMNMFTRVTAVPQHMLGSSNSTVACRYSPGDTYKWNQQFSGSNPFSGIIHVTFPCVAVVVIFEEQSSTDRSTLSTVTLCDPLSFPEVNKIL
jgi:hypothetical protein